MKKSFPLWTFCWQSQVDRQASSEHGSIAGWCNLLVCLPFPLFEDKEFDLYVLLFSAPVVSLSL